MKIVRHADHDAASRRPLVPALVGIAIALSAVLSPWGMKADAADPATTLLSLAPRDSLMLPPGEITGLAMRGDTLALLIVGSADESASRRPQVRLSFHDRRGGYLYEADFTGVLARGLAYDGAFYWSCGDDEGGGASLYKIEADTLVVQEVYPTPGHRPTGLCWDGAQVWITDRDSGRIDRFDPETEAVTRSVLAPGFSPVGLAWDGRYMWVTDSATGRLYRLAGSRKEWNATVDTAAFLCRGEEVLLLYDGAWLWYHRPGADRLFGFAVE